MDVVATGDPQEFLDRAAGHLAAEPVLTNVVGVVADRMRRGVGDRPDPWFATVEDGGRVVAVAMHTHPNAYVGPGPEGTGAAVATALVAAGRDVAGFTGDRGPAAEAVAAWTARRGGTGRVVTGEGLYVLGTLTPPAGVPGTARRADATDADLVVGWYVDFCVEAFAHRDPPPLTEVAEQVEAGLAERRWLLWDVDGAPVSLAGRSGPVLGVGRVGPVGTPVAHRRRGYAAMVTAATATSLLDDGAEQVMLFTDLANPTSNGVYLRLGFERVGDAVEYTLDPVVPPTG